MNLIGFQENKTAKPIEQPNYNMEKDNYDNPSGGKGSKRRPTNEKLFSENYEQVFGERKAWYEKEDRLAWMDQEDQVFKQRLSRLIQEKAKDNAN